MAASGLRALLLLSLLISAFACHRSPDPESRATELLTRSQGDDDWARSRWRLEPQNWDLGLNATAPWKGAEILPPPTQWGSELPDGKLPELTHQFDGATGKPRQWPMRYTPRGALST